MKRPPCYLNCEPNEGEMGLGIFPSLYMLDLFLPVGGSKNLYLNS